MTLIIEEPKKSYKHFLNILQQGWMNTWNKVEYIYKLLRWLALVIAVINIDSEESNIDFRTGDGLGIDIFFLQRR